MTSSLYAGSIILRNVSNVTLRARVWQPGAFEQGKSGALEADGRVEGLVGTVGLPGFEGWAGERVSWVLGMAPSEVVVSMPFTVKERLPEPAWPSISGEVDPMVLKGGNPPLAAKAIILKSSLYRV